MSKPGSPRACGTYSVEFHADSREQAESLANEIASFVEVILCPDPSHNATGEACGRFWADDIKVQNLEPEW